MKKNLILMSALFAGSMFMNDGFGANIVAAEIEAQIQRNRHQIDVVRQYGRNLPPDDAANFFNFDYDDEELLGTTNFEKHLKNKARLKKCVKYGLAATTAIAGVAAYLGHQYLPTVVACTAVPSVIPSKGGFNITEPMYCGIKSSTVPFQCGDYQNMTSLIAELDEKYPNLNSTKYSDTFKEICPDLDSDTQEDVELDNTSSDLKNNTLKPTDNIEEEHIDLDSDTQENVELDKTPDSTTTEIDEHICDGKTGSEYAGCTQGQVLGGYNKDNPRIVNILNFCKSLLTSVFNF